jgi:hypothetical protein
LILQTFNAHHYKPEAQARLFSFAEASAMVQIVTNVPKFFFWVVTHLGKYPQFIGRGYIIFAYTSGFMVKAS